MDNPPATPALLTGLTLPPRGQRLPVPAGELAQRAGSIPADLRDTTRWQVANRLRAHIASQVAGPAMLAVYLPSGLPEGHNLDLSRLTADLRAQGHALCLPRVVYPGHAVTFNLWEEGAPLDHDALGRPCAAGPEVFPALWVIPLAGYAPGGYGVIAEPPGSHGGLGASVTASLRHTLATAPRPLPTVGVCFTELETAATATPLRLTTLITGKETVYTV